ncbi:hypothetical protein [Negadavirga shengliensis]|uniref:Uncharacterized protein n=1 Tax=Negadavirga shengliensis TaxID=1389218 RepID=A0ABV9T669_9BACT
MQLLYIVLVYYGTMADITVSQENDALFMEKDNGLQLKIEVLTDTIHLNQPLPIKAVLTNCGNEPVMINKRLAVGYENSLSREIYVTITKEGDQTAAAYHPVDINRDFSPIGDYKLLYPQNSVSTTFDLFDFYRVLAPGRYRLAFYYEAGEPLAKAPDNVYKGRVNSQVVSIEVLPGILPEN